MGNRIKEVLQRLKITSKSVSSKKKLGNKGSTVNFSFKPSYTPEEIEKRRAEAMEYLLEKFIESQLLEEELKRKLESYGRFRMWIYKTSIELKSWVFILKEVILKPVGITIAAISIFLSIMAAIVIRPIIVFYVSAYLPLQISDIIGGIIAFLVAWSPEIIACLLYTRHLSKFIKKRLAEIYM